MLHLTPGFDRLRKDNCKTRRETFKFWNLVQLILEISWYIAHLVRICNQCHRLVYCFKIILLHVYRSTLNIGCQPNEPLASLIWTNDDKFTDAFIHHLAPMSSWQWNIKHSLYFALFFFREGKSNAHLNGDYQRIGDIMLNNMKVLQVRSVCIMGLVGEWLHALIKILSSSR